MLSSSDSILSLYEEAYRFSRKVSIQWLKSNGTVFNEKEFIEYSNKILEELKNRIPIN